MKIRSGIGCGILVSMVACGEGETGAPAANDSFVPARDLSLAELAASRPGPEFGRVVRTTRPSAFQRILDDRAAGRLSAAEADLLALSLQLGRLETVPDSYLADDALVTVPDSEPYLRQAPHE